jgi:tripartite-type tricarboxylate transporter receptor subunit TctC
MAIREAVGMFGIPAGAGMKLGFACAAARSRCALALHRCAMMPRRHGAGLGRFAARALASAAIASTGFATAIAQDYPSRPVRLIVATSPGGGTDTLARILGGGLSARLGQQFVVDNRPGGSGIVGTDLVARAAPDGHTLLMGFISSLAMTPAMMPTPYDPLKDLAAVSLVADAQYLLVVHPSVPARSLKEFVSYAKANPGRINAATAGYGTPVHLSAELFKQVAGIDIVSVPYKGGGPAAAAVLAGESQAIFGSVSATLPHIKAGKLIGLGTTGSKRSAAAPQFATIAEQGYPGFEVTSWYALMAPAGTPTAVIGKLNGAVQETLRDTQVREPMARQGLEPTGGSPADASAHIKREIATWARVIKAAGIKAQ